MMKTIHIAFLAAIVYSFGLCATYAYGVYNMYITTKNIILPSQLISDKNEGPLYLCFALVASLATLYCSFRFYKYCSARINPKTQPEVQTFLYAGGALAFLVEVLGIGMIICDLRSFWTHVLFHSFYLILSPIRYLLNDYEISLVLKQRVNKSVLIFDLCLTVLNILYCAAFIIKRKGMSSMTATIISIIGYICLIVNNSRIVYQTSLIGGKSKRN